VVSTRSAGMGFPATVRAEGKHGRGRSRRPGPRAAGRGPRGDCLHQPARRLLRLRQPALRGVHRHRPGRGPRVRLGGGRSPRRRRAGPGRVAGVGAVGPALSVRVPAAGAGRVLPLVPRPQGAAARRRRAAGPLVRPVYRRHGAAGLRGGARPGQPAAGQRARLGRRHRPERRGHLLERGGHPPARLDGRRGAGPAPGRAPAGAGAVGGGRSDPGRRRRGGAARRVAGPPQGQHAGVDRRPRQPHPGRGGQGRRRLGPCPRNQRPQAAGGPVPPGPEDGGRRPAGRAAWPTTSTTS
jgi:hypothetical protein